MSNWRELHGDEDMLDECPPVEQWEIEEALADIKADLAEIALITDMAKTTLHNRFGFAESFGDHEIRSPDRAFVWPLMETAGAKLSADWLNRRLV